MVTNGFSSRNPNLARGPQVDADTYRKLYGRGGSSSSRQPNVSINGETVFINGQGYSVAPDKQAQFLAGRGISISQSVSNQINEAKRQSENKRIIEQQRQAEIEKQRILELRKKLLIQGFQEREQILRDKRTGDKIRQQIIKTNDQNTRVIIQRNLNTGEISYRKFTPQGGSGVNESSFDGREIEKVKPSVSESLYEKLSKPRQVKDEGFSRKLNRRERLSNKVLNIIAGFDSKISNAKNILRTSARNKEITRLGELQRKMRLTPSEQAEKQRLKKKVSNNSKVFSKLIINTIGKSLVELGYGSAILLSQLATNPYKTITSLPSNVYQGVKSDFNRFITGDIYEKGQLIVEYVTFGKAIKGVSSITKSSFRAFRKLSPSYVKYVKGQFIFKKAPQLVIKSSTVKSGASKLSKQARLAGRKVTAVNASANQITSLIRRKQIIRKPITGEATFPSSIKSSLARFDKGIRLSNKEFARVNMWLRKNVASNITLLERSLYLDPNGGLRISRLGIQPEIRATLRDVLRGNFKLWGGKSKPQVLIFENAEIARFPKYLNSIKRKLLRDIPLTTKETNKLIRWQVKTGSGKFKPIGSTIYQGGRELEITLAPGEMIKRIKKIGFTYIEGKKVTFVTAKVYKPSRALLKQIKKAHLGKLNKNQVNKLNNFLSKKLGRRVKVETPSITMKLKGGRKQIVEYDLNIPVLRVNGLGLRVLSRGMKRFNFTRNTRSGTRLRISRNNRTNRTRARSSRTSRSGRITRRTSRPGRTTKRTSRNSRTYGRTNRTIRKTTRTSRPGRFGTRGTTKPPIVLRIPKNFKYQRLSSSVNTYYVVEKIRGKFRKLYPKPLTLKDARDYATYSIDNHLSKTAFFIPMGKSKRVVRPSKNISGYFNRNSQKFRPYRIRYGKKRRLVNGYIEKRRYFNDTSGERVGLRSLNRGRSRPRRRVKISASRRRQLIKQLKKARRIRMKMLRRRR